MAYTEYAKVISNNIVDDKFNAGKKVRVVNVSTKNGKEAIWDRTLDALAHLRPNQEIEVIRGTRGGLTVLQREQPRNVNGKGLKPINEVLAGNTLPTQSSYQTNGNGHFTAVNHQEDILDLDLPQPLTDAQKKAIHNLCIERARLLVHSIEVVRKELDNKGIEFHEGSIRSLGVSLFINISRHLP